MDDATGIWYKRYDTRKNREVNAEIRRIKDNGIQTLGEFKMFLGNALVFQCKTLELPWKDNQKRVSCIPKGEYRVEPYSSAKYPAVYEIKDVPGRSYILIHAGNTYLDILGCVLVGSSFTDINGDGEQDVIQSRDTLKKLKDSANYQSFNLVIY